MILTFVWICGFYYRAFRVEPCLLFVLVIVKSCLWLPRLGKRELVYVLLVHLFVCLARVNIGLFSFPLGIRNWLWLVIVTFPRLFY